jgi:D-alanyl-D-alanine endopeptidase (penicillin-binding protein 7)
MQAKVAGRKLIMVFLDSAGKLSRIGDAERVRKWVENHSPTACRCRPATVVGRSALSSSPRQTARRAVFLAGSAA